MKSKEHIQVGHNNAPLCFPSSNKERQGSSKQQHSA